jgi:ferredoxin
MKASLFRFTSSVKVTFRNADRKGGTRHVEAKVGSTLLEVAWAHGVDTLEGACDHCLACSTCQVRVRSPWKEKIKSPTEEELDMLDLAFEPDDDSRLACQILVKADLDGLEVHVPAGVTNRLQEYD